MQHCQSWDGGIYCIDMAICQLIWLCLQALWILGVIIGRIKVMQHWLFIFVLVGHIHHFNPSRMWYWQCHIVHLTALPILELVNICLLNHIWLHTWIVRIVKECKGWVHAQSCVVMIIDVSIVGVDESILILEINTERILMSIHKSNSKAANCSANKSPLTWWWLWRLAVPWTAHVNHISGVEIQQLLKDIRVGWSKTDALICMHDVSGAGLDGVIIQFFAKYRFIPIMIVHGMNYDDMPDFGGQGLRHIM